MKDYRIIPYNYKLMTGKWKIGIILKCGYTFCQNNELTADLIKISNNIYFKDTSDNLLPKETKLFYEGLTRVKENIGSYIKADNNLIINLFSIYFSDCNIQDEAFTLSAMEWAGKAFGFSIPKIKISFDNLKGYNGMYIFDF